MSSFNLHDMEKDANYRNYGFILDGEKELHGYENMTQSLYVPQAFKRIRHPELTPIIPRERDERNNEDLMTQSLIMPPFRRIRHSELTPVMPREKEIHSKHINSEPKPVNNGPKRAFSMTRLDQLARPRQRYLEESLKLRASVTKENLISPTRPTSSMSLASKQVMSNSIHGSVPMRDRTSARKPRPISYAGVTVDSPYNQISNERNSRSTIRVKFPFGSVHTSRTQSAGSSSRQSMHPSSGENITASGVKPTLPRKPAHVKAAASARKLAKQEQIEKIKKSESSPRLVPRLDTFTSDKMKKINH